jgi:hypothetical protein
MKPNVTTCDYTCYFLVVGPTYGQLSYGFNTYSKKLGDLTKHLSYFEAKIDTSVSIIFYILW